MSLEQNLLGGRLVYVLLLGVVGVAIRTAFMLPARLHMVG